MLFAYLAVELEGERELVQQLIYTVQELDEDGRTLVLVHVAGVVS